eukprot:120666-Rhodomonas_salina.2
MQLLAPCSSAWPLPSPRSSPAFSGSWSLFVRGLSTAPKAKTLSGRSHPPTCFDKKALTCYGSPVHATACPVSAMACPGLKSGAPRSLQIGSGVGSSLAAFFRPKNLAGGTYLPTCVITDDRY